MYFPYLKLRQQECLALRATVCKYNDNKVLPILDPFSEKKDINYDNKILNKVVNDLIVSKKKFILLIRDEVDLLSFKQRFQDFDKYCIRGFYNTNQNFTKDTTHDIAVIHVTTFATIKDSYNYKYHIMMPEVLTFNTYIKNYPTAKVVKIRDAFAKHIPNYSYPISDTFNSDDMFTFKQDGYAGFGDFTILEEGYEVQSGANASQLSFVIHLTRKMDNEDMLEVRHYLTTPGEEPDNKRRAAKTIQKAYNERGKFYQSAGIDLIILKNGESTNAAFLKRIGIIHHIELMRTFI